jgi:hypothetical protein
MSINIINYSECKLAKLTDCDISNFRAGILLDDMSLILERLLEIFSLLAQKITRDILVTCYSRYRKITRDILVTC